MDSTAPSNRGRVLVGKVGLDGHDRGAKVLVRMLREEGFEVSYLGVRSTPQQVADTALEKAVDVVAVSLLSGAHLELGGAVRRELDQRGLQHIPLALGGLIPARDVDALLKLGVARAFCPGQAENSPQRIPEAMDELVTQARQSSPPSPASGDSC